jgi:FKBP-type peptidyl-prolyl cis-trans isomerase
LFTTSLPALAAGAGGEPKRQVFIPPDLACGGRGAGAGIGPDATLIFEVDPIAVR